MIHVCCCWRVWERPCRRSWRQHRLKQLCLTCSAHPTCEKESVFWSLWGGLAHSAWQHSELGHKTIYFQGYKSVVRGRWWFENKRCGKHQLRLTRNWLYDEELVRFYHSICLLTGDWCWELPLRTDLSTCFSIFIFQFNWSKILKQKHEEIMNIYESMNMSICKNVTNLQVKTENSNLLIEN